METTNTQLSLGQRLAADTPLFFKKVKFIGLALIAVAGSLTQLSGLPVYLAPLLLGVGTTFTILSEFAVKDTSVLANPNATIADYSAVLADLPNQFEKLHDGIANTVLAVQAGRVVAAIPPVETPIVKEPAVSDQPPV